MWYRNPRILLGFITVPVFLFSNRVLAGDLETIVSLVAGTLSLIAFYAFVESILGYVEYLLLLDHERSEAQFRTGLLHATFTSLAFVLINVFALVQVSGSSGALREELTTVVQFSLPGSIIIDLLFNLGLALFIGGINFKGNGGRLQFSASILRREVFLLTIAFAFLAIPTLATSVKVGVNAGQQAGVVHFLVAEAPSISRVMAVTLLIIYVCYIFWSVLQLGDVVTRVNPSDIRNEVLLVLLRAIRKVYVTQGMVSLYEAVHNPEPYYENEEDWARDRDNVQQLIDLLDAGLDEEREKERSERRSLQQYLERIGANSKRERASFGVILLSAVKVALLILLSPVILLSNLVVGLIHFFRGRHKSALKSPNDEDSVPQPEVEVERREGREQRVASTFNEEKYRISALYRLQLFAGLVVGIGGIVYVSENLSHALVERVIVGHSVNLFFIGFLLLPLIGNFTDMTIAVSHAWQGKVQSSLAVTSQSAMQGVFLIAPILILFSSVVGVPTISLFYNLFIVAVIGLVIYLFQKVTEDGEATWFEGASLLGIFVVLGLVAFYFG